MPPSIDPPRAPREHTDRLLDVLASVRHNPARWAVPALAVVVAGFAVWRTLAPASPPPESRIPLATAATARPAVPATTVAARAVAVHVAGAVQRAGVLMLPDGSRVIDAVNAAGGPTPDADLARINLAAKLVDGTRIYLPRVGEQPLPGDGSTAGTDSGVPSGPVNLNTATADQLDALPGVGPATAAAIVAYRRDHGPFRSVDDLLEIRGIGPAKLEELRTQVTV